MESDFPRGAKARNSLPAPSKFPINGNCLPLNGRTVEVVAECQKSDSPAWQPTTSLQISLHDDLDRTKKNTYRTLPSSPDRPAMILPKLKTCTCFQCLVVCNMHVTNRISLVQVHRYSKQKTTCIRYRDEGETRANISYPDAGMMRQWGPLECLAQRHY